MKNNEWVIIIVVVAIVGVIAGMIGANISGNVIKVPTSISVNQTDVHTKAEVDKILLGFTAKSTVLNMLNTKYQSGYGGAIATPSYNKTCTDICKQFNQTCISSFGMMSLVTNTGVLNNGFYHWDCNQMIGQQYSYLKTFIESKNSTQLSVDCTCCST